MEDRNLPEGFSKFHWILAGFCSPILLWPLALLLSPSIIENPNLNEIQRTFMPFFMWLYPFFLGITARIIFKVEQKNQKLAYNILLISAVCFWLIFIYILYVGLS